MLNLFHACFVHESWCNALFSAKTLEVTFIRYFFCYDIVHELFLEIFNLAQEILMPLRSSLWLVFHRLGLNLELATSPSWRPALSNCIHADFKAAIKIERLWLSWSRKVECLTEEFLLLLKWCWLYSRQEELLFDVTSREHWPHLRIPSHSVGNFVPELVVDEWILFIDILLYKQALVIRFCLIAMSYIIVNHGKHLSGGPLFVLVLHFLLSFDCVLNSFISNFLPCFFRNNSMEMISCFAQQNQRWHIKILCTTHGWWIVKTWWFSWLIAVCETALNRWWNAQEPGFVTCLFFLLSAHWSNSCLNCRLYSLSFDEVLLKGIHRLHNLALSCKHHLILRHHILLILPFDNK